MASPDVLPTLPRHELMQYVDKLPNTQFCCAYGSAVVPQIGNEAPPMLDLIVAFDDPIAWHKENMKRNPSHYSLLSSMGPSAVTHLQRWGGGIYFNSAVINGRNVKYGTITIDDLCQDLSEWRTLYSSGRLQKPVQILQQDQRVEKSATQNRANALTAARLLLPPRFTDMELFQAIASLSYTGDFRNGIAEHPDKVQMLVGGQVPRFLSLYEQAIESMGSDLNRDGPSSWQQQTDPKHRRELFATLPVTMRTEITSATALTAQSDAEWRAVVQKGLRTIVGPSSRQQIVKGVLSFGLGRSIKYGLRKVLKAARVPV